MQGSDSKEWLVKSSGEIKGPYTFDEIAQAIATREIILVDEISYKFSRWKYLREEEAFDAVIAEIKNREYSKGEKTFTNSSTDTLTEDLSKEILNFSSNDELLSSVEQHLKEEESKASDQREQIRVNKEREEKEAVIKNYVLESEMQKKSSAGIWIFRFIVVLLIAGAFSAMFFIEKEEKQLSYDDIKKIAYDNVNYGNYPEARAYLEQALAVNSTNEELKYLLSYVSVDLDDNLTAQRLLTDLRTTSKDEKLKAKVLNLLGILHLKNFNLQESKDHFAEALELDPKFPAALFNQGVAYYLENKFEQAHQSFTQSLVHGGIDGNILLAMVEMVTRNGHDLSKDEKKKNQALDILSLIKRQASNLYAYRQELKIASAYVYYFLNDKRRMEDLLEDAINIDPNLTPDHVADVSYYRGLVTWDKLSNWIKKMRDSFSKNSTLRTLYGYSLFKGSDKLKGKDIVEGLLQSNRTNTSNQIISSYILMTLKRENDAKAALAPIMHHRDKSLPFVLMGKICLKKKDYPCADLNFSEALRIENDSIVAQAGLAEVYYNQGEFQQAKNLADKVYNLSPTYSPILATKKRIEGDLK